MAGKQDYLTICAVDAGGGTPLPVQVLQEAHCSRCFQSECARSLHGRSRFEQRITDWQSRLFTDVPRMDERDPRIVTLRAKKFLDIDAGPIPEIRASQGAWRDPRDLDVPAPDPQSTATASEPTSVPAAPAPVEAPVPSPAPPVVPRLLNTPTQQGRMIGGFQPGPARDPWEVRPQETKGLPVVKPGARVKIGGSGV